MLLDNLASSSSKWSVFNEKHVLFVGEHFVPSASTELCSNKEAANSYLPKILLGLGAHSVEAASSKRYVTHPYNYYDFAVILNDKKSNILKGVKCITVGWLKEYIVSHMTE